MQSFFLGTTPAAVLTNFLKHMSAELPKYVFEADLRQVDTEPSIESLVKQGCQPLSERVDTAVEFVSSLLDHLLIPEAGDKLRRTGSFANSYEIESFFHQLYQLTPLMTVTQALTLLGLYY